MKKGLFFFFASLVIILIGIYIYTGTFACERMLSDALRHMSFVSYQRIRIEGWRHCSIKGVVCSVADMHADIRYERIDVRFPDDAIGLSHSELICSNGDITVRVQGHETAADIISAHIASHRIRLLSVRDETRMVCDPIELAGVGIVTAQGNLRGREMQGDITITCDTDFLAHTTTPVFLKYALLPQDEFNSVTLSVNGTYPTLRIRVRSKLVDFNFSHTIQ